MASAGDLAALRLLSEVTEMRDAEFALARGISLVGAHLRLRRLERQGLAKRTRRAGVVLTSMSRSGRRLLLEGPASTRARVEQTLRANPRASIREVAKELQVSPTTAYHHLRRIRARES